MALGQRLTMVMDGRGSRLTTAKRETGCISEAVPVCVLGHILMTVHISNGSTDGVGTLPVRIELMSLFGSLLVIPCAGHVCT
jgi:hypothetical protein